MTIFAGSDAPDSPLQRLKHRLGLVVKGDEPAIMLVASSAASLTAVSAIITALNNSGSRLTIVLCYSGTGPCPFTRAQYPQCRLTVMPFASSLLSQFFLGRFRVRAVAFIEHNKFVPASFDDALMRRATPRAWLSGRGVAALQDIDDKAELVLATGPREGDIGHPDSQRVKYFGDEQHGFSPTDAAAIAQLLLPLIGRDRKWHQRRDFNPARWCGRLLYRRVANASVIAGVRQTLGGRLKRFDSVAALVSHLGQPRCILALGNGPSSEDPRVLNETHDVLFRANHSWQARGKLCQPHMVFTGQKSSMLRLTDTVLGVFDEATEHVLLSTRALSLWRAALHYAVLERLLGPAQPAAGQAYRPTSGAIMLAVAVAMQPERLVVSGMDMFQHPDGSYPGDRTSANAYTPAHALSHELDFILASLDAYRGELIIYSEALATAWAAHRA